MPSTYFSLLLMTEIFVFRKLKIETELILKHDSWSEKLISIITRKFSSSEELNLIIDTNLLIFYCVTFAWGFTVYLFKFL